MRRQYTTKFVKTQTRKDSANKSTKRWDHIERVVRLHIVWWECLVRSRVRVFCNGHCHVRSSVRELRMGWWVNFACPLEIYKVHVFKVEKISTWSKKVKVESKIRFVNGTGNSQEHGLWLIFLQCNWKRMNRWENGEMTVEHYYVQSILAALLPQSPNTELSALIVT